MRTVAIVSFAVLLLSPLALADLCPACKDKMFITNIGKCVECGGATSSGAFKLCPACSRKLKQCQACRAPLDAAKADDKGGDPPASPRRKPPLGSPIRLIDRPAGRIVNDCLVLSREDAGLTARPCVDQPVIVQLTGDRTSGWEWKFDKSSSDCLQTVGEPRRRETPVEEGMLGGTVVFLFPFRAVKPGQAVLLFRGGRPWDWEKNTTQTLKFNAPVREISCLRRERTNTPLQALVTLNDPQFVEASRNTAQLVLKETKGDAKQAPDLAARRILCRPLAANESAVVEKQLAELQSYYTGHTADADNELALPGALAVARQQFRRRPAQAFLMQLGGLAHNGHRDGRPENSSDLLQETCDPER